MKLGRAAVLGGGFHEVDLADLARLHPEGNQMIGIRSPVGLLVCMALFPVLAQLNLVPIPGWFYEQVMVAGEDRPFSIR